MSQQTARSNRFKQFVANEHTEIPDYVQAEEQAPKRPKLIDKHFRIKPEASQAFNRLVAQQYTGQGPQLGPTLIAEALNLLFEKYGVEPVA